MFELRVSYEHAISFFYIVHASHRGPNCALLYLQWHWAVNATVASCAKPFLHASILMDCPSLHRMGEHRPFSVLAFVICVMRLSIVCYACKNVVSVQ